MICPECGGKLSKKDPQHGACVKTCENCETIWFVLRLKDGGSSRGRTPDFGSENGGSNPPPLANNGM